MRSDSRTEPPSTGPEVPSRLTPAVDARPDGAARGDLPVSSAHRLSGSPS